MDYTGKEIIDGADKAAEVILKEKTSNRHRDHFFPRIIDALGFKIGVEVGVDKGEFSNLILERSKIESYYCIDSWMDNFGSNYRPDVYDKDGNKRYTEAYNNLKKYIDTKRTCLMQMTSIEACRHFGLESIDYCYIDGDHSLEGIYTDIKAWLPKVRVGGILAGHDYKDGPKSGINDFLGQQLDYKVKTVVDYYTQRYGHKLNIVGGRILSWWFVKNNCTEDHVKFCSLSKE
jgi:hypothetical protein